MSTSKPSSTRVVFQHQLRRRRAKRKRPPCPRAPVLTIAQILTWADDLHARTGQWPARDFGHIAGSIGETWSKVEKALCNAGRGLDGPSSLARLLAEHRGVRNPAALPPYTVKGILRWADAHHRRTGSWPTRHSGPIPEAPGETWRAVGRALEEGCRGFPGGSSLAQLLETHRAVRNRAHLPDFTERQILAWADAHHRRTALWPTVKSGPIANAPGETWAAVDSSLHIGIRGCPGDSSLAQLIAIERGVRNHMRLPPLTEAQILQWADAHHDRTGRWPTTESDQVLDAPEETWNAIHLALYNGGRGLGTRRVSLARFLAQHRGVPNRLDKPRLTIAKILRWADAHHRCTGRLPTSHSGPVLDAPGETWLGIDAALRHGNSGLPPGPSLSVLFKKRVRGEQMGRSSNP